MKMEHPSSPRQLEVEIINPKLACELNTRWHSRLPRIHWSNVVRNTHYICFGAKYNDRWYAVAIWSSPVAQNRFKDGKSILELRRFAISPESPKNTASRMMRIMISIIKNKFPDIKKLVSYQDTEVHKGTIYKASNWKVGAITKGMSWITNKRKRNPDQTLSDKIRWEYILK